MNNNVSGIFSDRLEALIAAALQDGVLTDKERELLKRRAEKEGEDWDEVEMIIEARLAEMQTEIVSAATPQMDAIELKDAHELYKEGCQFDISQNYEEAAKWYRKAAEQGNHLAQYNLGSCYYYGKGVSQNYEEAAKWYRKAAEQGNADAQCCLGNCYFYGEGVSQNYEEAAKWFRKAAERGNANGQCSLGYCYEYGYGVSEINFKEAVRLYHLAAEQGNATAQYNLGEMFYFGRGVPQNDQAARVLWQAAAEQGYQDAIDCLNGKTPEDDEDDKDNSDVHEKTNIFEGDYYKEEKNIVIPEGVTVIAANTCRDFNELENLTLPSTLVTIERKAFCMCSNLKKVDFTRCKHLKEIGDGAFWYCGKLKEVDFSLSTPLKRIGDETFYYCKKLQNIVLPDSVTFIGQDAFIRCEALRLVVLPASLEKLEDNVFRFCKFDNLDMSKVTHLSTIPKGFGCTKTMMIPQGVTTISESGFYNGSSGRKEILFLPSTLESYGKGNGEWNAIYLYAPQFEDLETLLECNNILYVLPQYLNVYKELWEALGKPNKNAEILPMPDEYLYYYDN